MSSTVFDRVVPARQLSALFLLMMISIEVKAIEWVHSPYISGGLVYDGNRALTTRPHEGVFGKNLTLSSEFIYETERNFISFEPLLRLERYRKNSSLDNETRNLMIDGTHQSERHRLKVNAGYANDNSLSGEFLEELVVLSNVKRKKINLNPSWKVEVADNSYLITEFDVIDASHDETSTGLVDYRYGRFDLRGIHVIEEGVELSGGLSFSRYTPGVSDNITDTAGVTIGYSTWLSDTSTLILSTGYRDLRLPLAAPAIATCSSDSSDGYLADINYKKKFSKSEISSAISRHVLPGSGGSMIETDTFSVDGVHNFSPMHTVRGGVSMSDNQRADSLCGNSWLYGQFYLESIFHLSEEFYLQATYRYRHRDDELIDEDATSNTLFINLTYSGNQRRLLH